MLLAHIPSKRNERMATWQKITRILIFEYRLVRVFRTSYGAHQNQSKSRANEKERRREKENQRRQQYIDIPSIVFQRAYTNQPPNNRQSLAAIR